jgi:hypothetical protein
MKTIHKFPLLFQQEQQIQIQPNAKPLAVQMQNGIPCLWAEVEAGEDPVTTTVRVLGTGFPRYADEDEGSSQAMQARKGRGANENVRQAKR